MANTITNVRGKSESLGRSDERNAKGIEFNELEYVFR